MEPPSPGTALQECITLLNSITQSCRRIWGRRADTKELDMRLGVLVERTRGLGEARITRSGLSTLEGMLKELAEDLRNQVWLKDAFTYDDVAKRLDDVLQLDVLTSPQVFQSKSNGATIQQQMVNNSVEILNADSHETSTLPLEDTNGTKIALLQVEEGQSLPDGHYQIRNAVEMAHSIKDATRLMHVFELSTRGIAQEAIERARAFERWKIILEKEIRKLQELIVSQKQYDKCELWSALMRKDLDLERPIYRHLGIVKELFELLMNRQITDFVLFEDILTAIVMAWTMVIGGEEYEIVINRDIRQTLSSRFAKRIQADALQYHQAENDQSVRNSQRKNGDLQSKFSEVYWKLLREFVKKLHAMKKSDVITTPEATYHSLLELIELGADQLPFLSDIKTSLESLGEQSPLMTQLASSIPRLEFSESASEIPEDETTLLSPFIWLPAPSKLSKTKAKTTKYASDGIDGLWVEAKKEYVNQMPYREGSMLAEYDLTRKINGVNRLPGGNVTELYKGTMREDSMKNQLAVKVFSPMRDLSTRQKAGVHFFMWARVWHALRHPNVVPFLGYILSHHLPFALVFPWYDSGNVIDYLKHNPAVSVHKRIRLIQDVVAGMTYLHRVATVHGDLRGETVLVADDGTARIANSATLHFMKKIASDIQINEHKRKECRFLAPELLNEYKPTFESDIWAFGCLASQILSDRAPCDNHDDPASVNSAINNGELPIRDIHERGQDNQPMVDLWQIITSCWAQDPESRPTAQNIQSLMQGLASSGAAIDANGHNKDPLSDKIGDERSYLQGNGDN